MRGRERGMSVEEGESGREGKREVKVIGARSKRERGEN